MICHTCVLTLNFRKASKVENVGVGPWRPRFADLGKYSSRAYDFNFIAFLIKMSEHVCTVRYKITKIKFRSRSNIEVKVM